MTIQAYDTYPLPKSLSPEQILDRLTREVFPEGLPEGTKVEDGGGAWILMIPVGNPFEGSLS